MSMTTQQTERGLQNLSNKALNCDFAYYLDSEQIKIFNAGVSAMADQVFPLLTTIAQQGEALEAEKWRSMDSAPMDGTLVILYGDSFWTPGIVPTCPDLFNLVVQGHFSGGHWQIGGRTLEAKMWMPLPDAPVAAIISQKVEG